MTGGLAALFNQLSRIALPRTSSSSGRVLGGEKEKSLLKVQIPKVAFGYVIAGLGSLGSRHLGPIHGDKLAIALLQSMVCDR